MIFDKLFPWQGIVTMTYRRMLLILEPDDDCVGGADGGAHGPDELPEVP